MKLGQPKRSNFHLMEFDICPDNVSNDNDNCLTILSGITMYQRSPFSSRQDWSLAREWEESLRSKDHFRSTQASCKPLPLFLNRYTFVHIDESLIIKPSKSWEKNRKFKLWIPVMIINLTFHLTGMLHFCKRALRLQDHLLPNDDHT